MTTPEHCTNCGDRATGPLCPRCHSLLRELRKELRAMRFEAAGIREVGTVGPVLDMKRLPTSKPKLPKEIQDTLNELDVPWSVEIGKAHYLIRINGKLAAIAPKSKKAAGGLRGYKNIISNIKRAVREADGGGD